MCCRKFDPVGKIERIVFAENSAAEYLPSNPFQLESVRL